MAKINGTDLLVYADGTLIAYQKTCTVNWDQELPDATTKDSGGWEEHLNGTRRSSCDFDGLYSTTGLSADDLITDIINRTSIVLLVNGTGVPIVGEARPKNLSINAAMEEPGSISGSFIADGGLWMLAGANVNLVTDPADSNTYDTLTTSSLKITSAISASGSVQCKSNDFAVTDTYTYKFVTYLHWNSGQLPSVSLYDTGTGLDKSNVATLVAGVNVVTLTSTVTDATVNLRFTNTSATNWDTEDIYVFKA